MIEFLSDIETEKAAWLTLTYRIRGQKDGVILGFIKLAIEIIFTIGLAICFQMIIKQFIKGIETVKFLLYSRFRPAG